MISEQPAKVLMVDDYHLNRLILERSLKRAGYEVTSARDGAEALELLKLTDEKSSRPSFDVIVLDIMMPGIDGTEVLERTRKKYPPEILPIIMATAKDESDDVVHALSLGANDYITKPIDIPVLLARIEVHVTLRRTHLALQIAQATLVEAAKMESIGRMAAGVAHEVKNPLYVLQMGVDFFEMTLSESDAATQKTLHNMQNAIDRADTIIRSMVDFSRTEELKLVKSDLHELIHQSIPLVQHEIRARQITLELELPENMPRVTIDKTKIQQVLINLLANACHAMEDGGTLRVRTSHFDPAALDKEERSHQIQVIRNFRQGLLLEVIDEGTGIPEEHMMKLFDAFFTSKPAGLGTGLGLAVTKTIIDLHGGFIELLNNEDRGASARIYLDVEGPREPGESQQANPPT
ncbi:MAG: response regulator [Opitutales bacterium]